MEARRLILFLAPLLLAWHWYEPAARRNGRGLDAYRRRDFQRALQLFLEAKGLRPEAPALRFNTAAALYQLKKYREALDEFGRIDPRKAGTVSAADLAYNQGNGHYRQKQYDQAVAAYTRCLLARPDDLDAKKNLELALRQRQQQQQQPQNPPPQKLEQKPDYKPLLQFLNQNERQQMEKRKRRSEPAANPRDW